jgi:hypothetical protein
VYQEQTAPLQAYYHNELITIAGVGAIDEVFTRVFYKSYSDNHRSETNRESSHEGIVCNACCQHRRPEYNRQLDDGFRQADRFTPQRDMPRPPSRAWDGMTRPLRVGVIGANPNRSWAKDSHMPALRSLENVQLAAVATTSRASADAAAAAFGVRAA